MKARLNTVLITAGVAGVMLTSCVSSKKYHKSQNELAMARNDSAMLAQRVDSLNGNVRNLQDKNTALQQSLDKSTSDYAASQKSLGYYQGYFKDQQNQMSQVSDDVKGALTQAGISNGDVEMTNNVIYVRLDENELFHKNSTAVSANGKKALDGLADVIKNRSNVNVFVASGDSSVAGATVPEETAAPAPRHHRSHPMHKASGSMASTSNSNTGSTNNTTTAAPKKVHHHYSSEGSMAFSNGMGHMHHAYALKQGRMVTVANHFLKSGVNKINVTLQHPNMNGPQSNTIKVVITPKMEDFNPQGATSSASTLQSDAASR